MATSISTTATTLLAVLFLVSALSPSPSLAINSDPMSVWEQLEYNGLPRGLLPNTVTSYTFDEDTRRFEVTLPRSCQVQFDYLIKYGTKITGTLNFGSIKDLKGVQASGFVIWTDVSAIEADIGNGSVDFRIGIFTKTYPLSDFKDVPSCKKSVSLRGGSTIFPIIEQVVAN